MKCRKCGSGNMGVMPNKKNPSATDLYCLDCGAWQKFATKDEIRLYQCKKGPITNADRIRSMDDERLAKLFYSVYKRSCIDFVNQSGIKAEIKFDNSEGSEAVFLKYLQQPAKEDTDG